MNSSNETFQNRNTGDSQHETTGQRFYMTDLELERLKDICANIDPFRKIDQKTYADLSEMGIDEVDDPFKLTNHLLRILEENLNHRQRNEQASRATSREH